MFFRRIVPVLFALVLFFSASLFLYVNKWWHTPSVNPYYRVYLLIKPGASVTQIAHALKRAGLIQHPHFFVWELRCRLSTHQIKAGDYLFHPRMTPAQLFDILKTGRVLQYQVTLLEGDTFKQWQTIFSQHPLVVNDLKGLSEPEMITYLHLPITRLEGWFYPDTYAYRRGTTQSVLLLNAYKTMVAYLNQAWAHRAADLPYRTPYDALIVASLIEKESANQAERPEIASVIVNRLRLGMPLQIDPTVIYGLGDQYHGDIKTKDLKQDTPYNTYLHRGLPPTPIAMPSPLSIMAALHPSTTAYLYFVAKGDGSHTHQFSKTLQEHRSAVKAYIRSTQTSLPH